MSIANANAWHGTYVADQMSVAMSHIYILNGEKIEYEMPHSWHRMAWHGIPGSPAMMNDNVLKLVLSNKCE